MVTFTSYGRADQLQIFRLLRLNCKLLIMPSDAAGVSANKNLGNALLPPTSYCHRAPVSFCVCKVHAHLTPFELDWPLKLLSGKNASPTTLGRVPNTQIRTLSEFQGFCFCFPEWVLFAQLERSVSRHIYKYIYIIYKTEGRGLLSQILYYALLFHLG